MMKSARTGAALLFVSQSLTGHLLRGAAAFALLFWAATAYRESPGWALGAVGLSLVAMRGCPMCWIGGLFDIFAARRCGRCRAGSSPDRR